MRTVVITGSTKGIGLGLAREFLKRDCRVFISSRTSAAVERAVAELGAQHGADRVGGSTCDVGRASQLQSLWDAAAARFGKIDIWLNNAGMNLPRKMFWDIPEKDLRAIISTNLEGAMFGSQVALKGMLAQGGGALYNMEGFGSDGMVRVGLAAYGATKSALTYLTKSLIKEVEGKSVIVGFVSPGIVVTDLLEDGYGDDVEAREKAKKTLNILADRVETVTPFLAEKILANSKNGARIAWLTTGKVAVRFATSPFVKRDVLGEGKP